MKKIVLLAVVLLFPGISSCNRFSSSVKKAKMAEATGNLQEAYTFYVDALLKDAPSMKMPDVNRSKFLDPGLWKKEVEKYMVWISSDHGKLSPGIRDALEGANRCADQSRSDNSLANYKAQALSSQQYQAQWNKTFFAPTASVNPEHKMLASGNFSRNISFVEISSPKSYTYELSLINKSNGTKTELFLYSESSISFMAAPGDYLLVCRSSVTFSSGKLWRSQYAVLPLQIPAQASIITGELRTSIDR